MKQKKEKYTNSPQQIEKVGSEKKYIKEVEEIAEQIHLSGRKYDMYKYKKEVEKLLRLIDEENGQWYGKGWNVGYGQALEYIELHNDDYWVKCPKCKLNYPKGKEHYCGPIESKKDIMFDENLKPFKLKRIFGMKIIKSKKQL
jgi:hypothetical protein